MFLLNSLEMLKPGGVSVHTAEFNLSTPNNAGTKYCNVFGKVFFDNLKKEVNSRGHFIAPFDYRLGDHPEEDYIFQWEGTEPHFKLLIDGYVATSIGVIMVKGKP